jgi:2-amino-4-hydroxy-6-hydroxymethyldihydropteridine diphosphokinase
MGAIAYVGLGSNLGDRREYLNRALQALRGEAGIEVTAVSGYHETAPVGGPPDQPNYLNAAAELRTDVGPAELLSILLNVERAMGRIRGERFGPRIIDLDLLLYDDVIQNDTNLIVPHPRMHERAFVLGPLAEIAPDMNHPVLKKTIRELAEAMPKSWEIAAPSVPATRAEERVVPAVAGETHKEPGRELAGLRTVVTGSTSGIGLAIALELAVAGARVIFHGRRKPSSQPTLERMHALDPDPHFLLADLSTPAECARLVAEAWVDSCGIDAWINNAGADTLTGPAVHWSFETKLQQLLQVDVTATILLARDVGRRMKQQGHGVIINVGWDQAETGMEGDSGQLFAASKAAVMAFSKSLALTLAPEVRVNCLAPGWIKTAWGETASARWHERVNRETPLKRWGTPQDVAAVARWLLSPAASFITGQVIRVNGGAVR